MQDNVQLYVPTPSQEKLMAKTVADVMKDVKDNDIKFVDFRFTDTRGKEDRKSTRLNSSHT